MAPYNKHNDKPMGKHAAHAAPESSYTNDRAGSEDSHFIDAAPRPVSVSNGPTPHSSRADEVKRLRSLKPHKRKWPVVVGVIVVLVAVLGVSGFFLVDSAKALKSEASTVMTDVSDIQDAVKAGNYDKAASSAKSLQSTAADMKDQISNPLWTVASLVPVVGSDISGVKTVVEVLDDAATNALVPLTEALQATPPSDLVRADGSIDVSAVESLTDIIQEVAPVMQRCADNLESVPDMNIEQLQSVMGSAKEKVSDINELFQQVDSFAPLLSSFLGGDGAKTYLIAAQNSAEMRSAGGFPGSIGTLSISDGAISLNDFGSVWDVIEWHTSSTIPITDEENEVFLNRMQLPHDSGFNPDFTRVAPILSTAYEEKNSVQIDGVISVTPSVVQKLLSITGPITLSDGTVLNGSNATKVLQHDLYWKYCSAQAANPDGGTISDALFAEAANLAFSKLLSNLNADSLMDLASVFAECTDDREIMLWLDDAEDQQLLEEAGFAGALSDDSTQPELGVFFDLIVGSKLGWYVDINTDLGEPEEQADGSLVYQVTTTVTNTVDPSEVEAGGTYIMGADYDLGNMQPILYLFGPAGGSITNFTSSVGDASLTAEYEGLDVIRLDQPELRPGQSITMKYTVTTAAGTEEPLKILSMPTLSEYR